MEVRCQNCDARLSVPSVGPAKKTRCPKCGTLLLVSPAEEVHAHAHAEKRERETLRRVFEPIPQAATYAGGFLLVLVLFSWLWLPAVMDLVKHKPVFLNDSSGLPSATNAVPTQTRDLTSFGGIRLDARREDLERSFGLALQNTRGMRPEIYEGRNAGDITRLVTGFYDGRLKEATLLMRERPVAPEALEQELVEQFGDPQARTDETTDASHAALNGLHLDAAQDELASKLAGFQHRRALRWTDGSVRVDALIYFNNSALGLPTAVLQVHLAETAWLQTSQTAVRPVGLRP